MLQRELQVGSGTSRVGYYVAHNSLIGADLSVAADSSGQLYIPSGFYRYVQHTTPRPQRQLIQHYEFYRDYRQQCNSSHIIEFVYLYS
jgi:hypothetical protein